MAPDGRAIVYVATDGEVARLWLRPLAEMTARPLVGTENAASPFWSPDGRAIGFFADGTVKAIDLQTRVVRMLSTAPVPAGAAWSPDGIVLHPLVPDSALVAKRADNGPLQPATQLTTGQTGHRGPAFLPDGRRFLFYAAGRPDARGIHVGELGTFRTRRLLDADSPAVFVPPAHVMYVQHGTLFAHAFDAATATLSGEPVAMIEHVFREPSAGLPAVSAASTGTIAYRTGPVGEQRQLIWFDRRGTELARVGVPEERGPAYGSIAPDGRRLAVQRTTDGIRRRWSFPTTRGCGSALSDQAERDSRDRVAQLRGRTGWRTLFARRRGRAARGADLAHSELEGSVESRPIAPVRDSGFSDVARRHAQKSQARGPATAR
jgi:eukaryotic-like serine/threonine-protein kinase